MAEDECGGAESDKGKENILAAPWSGMASLERKTENTCVENDSDGEQSSSPNQFIEEATHLNGKPNEKRDTRKRVQGVRREEFSEDEAVQIALAGVAEETRATLHVLGRGKYFN